MPTWLRYVYPSYRLRFETRYAPDEVEEGISELMRGRYDGRVSEAGFQFRPIAFPRNAFLPWILGRIEPRPYGARVDVSIRCGGFPLVFMTLWLTMAIVFSLAITVLALLQLHPVALAGPVMPLLGVALLWFGFGRYARPVEDLLRNALPPASPDGEPAR